MRNLQSNCENINPSRAKRAWKPRKPTPQARIVRFSDGSLLWTSPSLDAIWTPPIPWMRVHPLLLTMVDDDLHVGRA